MAQALAAQLRVHRDRANLREVLPQHVQRAAADDAPVLLDDPELLHVLVQRDHVLGQQNPAGIAVDQRLDPGHVIGSCSPRVDPTHVGTLAPRP